MSELIKDKAISMGKYIIQASTILIILMAFTLPAVAALDPEMWLNRTQNLVATDVENEGKTDDLMMARGPRVFRSFGSRVIIRSTPRVVIRPAPRRVIRMPMPRVIGTPVPHPIPRGPAVNRPPLPKLNIPSLPFLR